MLEHVYKNPYIWLIYGINCVMRARIHQNLYAASTSMPSTIQHIVKFVDTQRNKLGTTWKRLGMMANTMTTLTTTATLPTKKITLRIIGITKKNTITTLQHHFTGLIFFYSFTDDICAKSVSWCASWNRCHN